jgi:C4-dicarboxylate transporter, DcuC family
VPDLGVFTLILAGLIIVASVYAIAKGFDVRLTLIVAAFAIAGLKGDVAPILREFLATFSNEKFVIPICTAMGFAYVLRHTECDQHLVQLLTKPLRRFGFFLIPGVVLVGFTVNIPVISQTSTAVCIGAVVVPLMRAAGISSITIGATILLGASIGGELLNPGAPELNTVGQRLEISSSDVIPHVQKILFLHLAVATAIYWFLAVRAERRVTQPTPAANPLETRAFRLNLVRALIPLVPLILLFLIGKPLEVFTVPKYWVVDAKAAAVYETRLIGGAMLFGVVVAALAARDKVAGVPKAFFDGAGYAFAEVVSLIVVAQCFGKAIELVGLAGLIGKAIEQAPSLLIPTAGAVPMAFGFISGSGMAATQSLYGFFVEPAQSLGADPKDVGAVVSMAAAAGRTMSPVAAVALMCAKLTGTNSFELVRRVALPLIASLAITLAVRSTIGW